MASEDRQHQGSDECGEAASVQRPCDLLPPASTLSHDLAASVRLLRKSAAFADVILVASTGEHLPAHRLVLAARSVHFAEQLGLNSLGESACSSSGELPGRMPVDACFGVLNAALDYLYTEELPTGLPVDVVLQLRRAANTWQLPGLEQLAARTLAESLSTDSVCEVLRHCSEDEVAAKLAGHTVTAATKYLRAACGQFGAANYEKVRSLFCNDKRACPHTTSHLTQILVPFGAALTSRAKQARALSCSTH
eukprot:6202923-Pleurochrysis_carterae.AAC.2